MPTKSKSQRRLMQAVAHNPKFAKDANISQAVAREILAADAAGTYKKLPERVKKRK